MMPAVMAQLCSFLGNQRNPAGSNALRALDIRPWLHAPYVINFVLPSFPSA
jgi:hypothetical protein